jgi:hypothetical protein
MTTVRFIGNSLLTLHQLKTAKRKGISISQLYLFYFGYILMTSHSITVLAPRNVQNWLSLVYTGLCHCCLLPHVRQQFGRWQCSCDVASLHQHVRQDISFLAV